jgi:hypothetical protein
MPGPSVHAQQRLGTDASRARAHAAARIDGAECSRALQVRRRWRRRSGDGSYWCSTPSSCDGVECVFAFPVVGARHRARRCKQVRCRHRLHRRPDVHGSKEASAQCKATRRPPRCLCFCLHGPRSKVACTRQNSVKCFYSEIYVRKSDLRRRTLNAQRALLARILRLTGRDETSVLTLQVLVRTQK